MDDDEPPRPMFSLLFWAALGSAAICIAGGAVVGLYGPRLFPAHAASPHTLGKPSPPR